MDTRYIRQGSLKQVNEGLFVRVVRSTIIGTPNILTIRWSRETVIEVLGEELNDCGLFKMGLSNLLR